MVTRVGAATRRVVLCTVFPVLQHQCVMGLPLYAVVTMQPTKLDLSQFTDDAQRFQDGALARFVQFFRLFKQRVAAECRCVDEEDREVLRSVEEDELVWVNASDPPTGQPLIAEFGSGPALYNEADGLVSFAAMSKVAVDTQWGPCPMADHSAFGVDMYPATFFVGCRNERALVAVSHSLAATSTQVNLLPLRYRAFADATVNEHAKSIKRAVEQCRCARALPPRQPILCLIPELGRFDNVSADLCTDILLQVCTAVNELRACARACNAFLVVGVPIDDTDRLCNGAVVLNNRGETILTAREHSPSCRVGQTAAHGEADHFPFADIASGVNGEIVRVSVVVGAQFTRATTRICCVRNEIELLLAVPSSDSQSLRHDDALAVAIDNDVAIVGICQPHARRDDADSANDRELLSVNADGSVQLSPHLSVHPRGVRRPRAVPRRPELYGPLTVATPVSTHRTNRTVLCIATRYDELLAVLTTRHHDHATTVLVALADRVAATLADAIAIAQQVRAAIWTAADRPLVDVVLRLSPIATYERTVLCADGIEAPFVYTSVHAFGGAALATAQFRVFARPYGDVALVSGADLLVPETMWVLAKLGASVAVAAMELDLCAALGGGAAARADASPHWLWRNRASNGVHLVVANGERRAHQAVLRADDPASDDDARDVASSGGCALAVPTEPTGLMALDPEPWLFADVLCRPRLD